MSRGNKREREPEGEPISEHQQQASVQQTPAEAARARVWEMHLRGVPKVRIAAAVNLDRGTVAKIITRCYAEAASERKFSPAAKLDGAIQRMRRIQEQAWTDHDEDDARELNVLNMCMARAAHTDAQDASDAKSRDRSASSSASSVRYQSQRSQYLRIILDAEKEIARLEGLYEGLLDVEGGVVFRIIRGDGDGLLPSSARPAGIPAPQSDGDSDG